MNPLTPDELGRILLDICRDLNMRSGHMLLPGNLLARWPNEYTGKERAIAVRWAMDKGYLQENPRANTLGALMLTDAGFAAI